MVSLAAIAFTDMIGVFDSGIGGLSVLRVLRRAFPRADFVYFGDTARVPYGGRSEETIRSFCRQGAEYLHAQGVALMVIACNTASAIARDTFEFVGVPVVDVIAPTVEAVRAGGWNRVAVIGTNATIGSHVYARRLQEIGLASVREIACPLFVPLIEEGFEKHSGARAIVETYLMPLHGTGTEALILGCTHYPFMAATIGSVVGRNVQLIESGPAVLNHFRDGLVAERYSGKLFDGEGSLRLALTDARGTTVELARKWLGEDVKVEKVVL